MKKLDITDKERKKRAYITTRLYESRKRFAKICSKLEVERDLEKLEKLLYKKHRMEHRIENLIKERNGEPFELPLARGQKKEETKKERRYQNLSNFTKEEKLERQKKQQAEWYKKKKNTKKNREEKLKQYRNRYYSLIFMFYSRLLDD